MFRRRRAKAAARAEDFESRLNQVRLECHQEIERLQGQIRDAASNAKAEALAEVFGSTKRTIEGGPPNTNPLAEMIRDIAILRWNFKVLGAKFAQDLFEKGVIGPNAVIPVAPVNCGLTSKLCVQDDMESDWLRHWCGQVRMTPLYSRKIWEYAYVLQAVWEAGLLEPGRAGLGFAVGNEATPAYFASRGLSVLATDLSTGDERSKDWSNTNQHAANLDVLFRGDLIARDAFERLCSFRPVDMNHIPEDLYGKFDFCWSMCSFEHVGSLELGLQFVQNSVKCLKTRGIAVHTTEFNFEASEETIDNWPSVLFQPRHIAELERRLASDGHYLMPVNYDPGSKILDSFIDGPPYSWQPHPRMHLPDTPHLRLNVDGFPVTSIGLIVKANVL